MPELEIEIDGRKLTVQPNQTIIQAADAAGIYIPRFCYHKHLAIVANCRMCLVEVEKAPKPMPACATPVMAGMKVHTQSAKTIAAQRAVMEFLLINHPLDCPICDQGGECELQDLAMGYGSPHSYYSEKKRAVPNPELGPLVATEMTRCIHCTRCVRFGDEIAGMRELGGTYRGEFMKIETYVKQAMRSEVSGNIIDLCPVGALTSKPFRFQARAWEMQQFPGIAAHDCIGSHLNFHTRGGKVMRVVPRENPVLNQTWLSDRDRFSYTGLYHPDRLTQPRMRVNGRWQEVGWEQALEKAATRLQQVIAAQGPDQLAALASPSSTLEEFYLLQKVVRSLGCHHIDHRLRENDFSDEKEFPAFPGMGLTLNELEACDAILLIGSNIQKEQPLASTRVRKAALNGAKIMVLNPIDYALHFPVSAKNIVAPHLLLQSLAAIVKSLLQKESVDAPVAQDVEACTVDAAAQTIAETLRTKKKVAILLGACALTHPEAAAIRYLAQMLTQLTNGKLGMLTLGANQAGGWLAGAIPHRLAGNNPLSTPGLNARQLLEKPRKAYILLNVEPELDCANSLEAVAALQQAECVIALSLFRNPVLEAHAEIILPMAPFTETGGTFINAWGDWQSFNGVASPYHAARPAWKILRTLGNFLHLNGFDYNDVEDVRREVRTQLENTKSSSLAWTFKRPSQFSLAKPERILSRVGDVPLYAIDSLVRRAQPLQEAQVIIEGELARVSLHPDTAKQLKVQDGEVVNVQQGQGNARLKVCIDHRVPAEAAWIYGGIAETAGLGALWGTLELRLGE